MMTVDPHGHGGFLYLVLGLVCPGFIALITIGLSSADLMRQLITAPGVLNTGMGSDGVG